MRCGYSVELMWMNFMDFLNVDNLRIILRFKFSYQLVFPVWKTLYFLIKMELSTYPRPLLLRLLNYNIFIYTFIPKGVIHIYESFL